MGQIISLCRPKKNEQQTVAHEPVHQTKCEPLEILPGEDHFFPAMDGVVTYFPYGYFVLVKTKYDDLCRQTSNQWIQDLRLAGEICDPDGWRHMKLSFDTPVNFTTFRKAFNGANTTMGKKYLLTKKENDIWYIITVKGK